MLAPIQELQRASLRKANLFHLSPLVPRCVPLSILTVAVDTLDSSGCPMDRSVCPNRF